MFDCDVLVVGAGPVGETLLALLGSRGVSAIGLEKDLDVWPLPRAVHFDGEVLRIFQSIGLGDAIAAQCLPMLSYRMENEAGEVVFDVAAGRPGTQGWHEENMFHQPDIDAVLRSEIKQWESVELLDGHTVVDVTADHGSVTAVVRDVDGNERRLQAKYLVGCDGASSFVRKVIGAERESLGPNDPWLIVDGILPQAPPIEGSMVFFGHHSRPKIWAAMPGGRGRMEFKVLPTDDLDEITTSAAVTRMSGGLLRPDNFIPTRTAVYTFRSSMTKKWHDGRIFLAGDAAHLAPPLFGRGLCSGIRDVANLAWKLDYVLRGAAVKLLDTYESERQPHARSWIEQSTRLSVTIQTTDERVAAHRDEFLRAHSEDVLVSIPPLGPGLQEPTDDDSAGTLSVQPILSDGRRFDDLVGRAFVVVATAELSSRLSVDIRDTLAASEFVHLVAEGDPGFGELLNSVDAEAVVIRPDRYVLGVARTAAQFDTLARRVIAIVDCSGGSDRHAAMTLQKSEAHA